MTWCACRGFLFLFCSFLVNFTNLSWKEFNIILIILIYWVELYYYLRCFCFCYSCFLFCFCLVPGVGGGGGGGCISIHEKDRGLRQHTIYVLVYYILFFHFLQLWVLSVNVMCHRLQIVLWFHLLSLLNLGSTSRLQGFIWRSADKVPAWKSEQLLVPCNWWHPLGACWSACKTKPLQTGVKCSWFFFCRIKVAWRCHCFAWEQMID